MSASDHPAQPRPAPTLPTAIVDLNAAWQQGVVSLSAESREDPSDRAHRQKLEAADAAVRRGKDGVLFALLCLLFMGVTVLSAYLALNPRATPDEKSWGRTGLTAVLGGAVGYLLKRSEKPDP